MPKPRPLDHLVGALFAGPTLVLNGALDPLQKAVDRAEVCCCLIGCCHRLVATLTPLTAIVRREDRTGPVHACLRPSAI